MTKNKKASWQLTNPESLANQFSRLGWIGFWIQVALLAISIFLLLYALFFSGPESAAETGLDLGDYLSYISLMIMMFTTFWFYMYTRLSKQIVDPNTRPSSYSVQRRVWVGLWASSIDIFFSMALMLNYVGRLMLKLLATPQTGLPMAQLGDTTYTLSAMNAVSLMSLQLILTAEMVVLGFSIWLLFQVTRPTE